MQKNKLEVISLVLILSFAISALATEPSDTLNDGPHIIWQNDTTAVAFYYCNEQVVQKQIHSGSEFSFYGLCDDSLVSYTISKTPFTAPPEQYESVSRLFAVSDLHGEYEHFVDILLSGGIVDQELQWSFGDGHLVINGDIFDRGDQVTECLWLIYRLEQEAAQAGGRVHTLLGNHELMVLRGDNRYIHDKYLKGICRKSRISHIDLFGLDSELGRWLRSKNTVEIINNIMFVHGGVSPFMVDSGYTVESINETVRASLDLRSSQLIFADPAKFLYGSRGPIWYRGYHYEMEDRYPMATVADVDRILDHFGATTVIVGHSEVDSVMTLFDRRLIGIDVPVDELGSLQALLWKNGRFYRVHGNGTTAPID